MGADPIHKEVWIITDFLWDRRKRDTLGKQGDREIRSKGFPSWQRKISLPLPQAPFKSHLQLSVGLTGHAGGRRTLSCLLSHQDMGSITAEVTPDLLPVLLQHHHRFTIFIPGDNGTFSHRYSPSDPSPLLSPLFVISHKPFSFLSSFTSFALSYFALESTTAAPKPIASHTGTCGSIQK